MNKFFFKIINFIKNFCILNLIYFKYKNSFKKGLNTKILIEKNYSETKIIFYKNICFLINPKLKDFYKNNLNINSFDHLFLTEKPDFFTLELIKLIKKKNKNLKLHCDFIYNKYYKKIFLQKDIFLYVNERENILALKNIELKITYKEKKFSINFIKSNNFI